MREHINIESTMHAPVKGRRRRLVGATVVAVLLAVAAAAWWWQPWQTAASPVAASATPGIIYTCPMHPQIRESEPGVCPICSMDLVPVKAAAVSKGSAQGSDALVGVTITPRERIVADVQTVAVGRHTFAAALTVPAVVDYDEAAFSSVTSWIRGRIERLYVNQTGVLVHKGEPLMRIYSPDLLTAQQEYLVALESEPIDLPEIPGGDGASHIDATTQRRDRSQERWRRMVESSRKKLELYGMSDAQIEELKKKGDVSYETTVFARSSGYVTELDVSEGAYVNEGTLLMQVVDLSSVWVMANVYENDVWRVHGGMQMSLTGPAIGGATSIGRVDYVYPEVDPQTRTTKVRAVFANPGLKLKPGMYLTASIRIPHAGALAVPSTSVIRTGRRDMVYVEVAHDTFEPREVTLGDKDGDFYEVVGGEISEGDRVVEQGGFLIDSERQLTGGGA